ncbi:MAG: GMC family oxidoreductase N-terminal domain-containing protein [Hyphomicrobiales bacterium]|nr:GMC family oxidoreductase N-terminal domain-containing protein [Hyphomicrobiales bacterium]
MAAEADAFDYVIVGAGAAGCVLANRIAAAGLHTVCLLEAGPPDRDIFLHIPAGVYKASSNPRYAWLYETEPGPGTANRPIPMPQGRTLGGSTSINGMNYNRGCAQDFDGWAERGNRGWSYAEVLPYFKRSERKVGACDPRYHGADGPMPITESDWRHPLCDAFIAAAHQLGLPHNPDYNGASQAGVGYYQRYIENGWRVSAASAFLRPVAKKLNLEIRTDAEATAVIFDGRRAVGVRYAAGAGGAAKSVTARREVILSAGAANSAKLLQISGVGPSALLSELGVPVVHDLPGVGANLQDHYMIHLVAKMNTRTISGRGLALLREGAKWLFGQPSVLSLSPSLVYGFANSRDLCSTPDVQIDVALGNYASNLEQRFPVVKVGFYQLRPSSVGYVRARSADPFAPPIIQPNYLEDERDQRVAIDGVAAMRRILAAPALRAYYDGEELPGASVVDEAGRLDFAREAGLTAYHPCGTCRMGPRSDPTAVVDDELRVHGLGGLRVADASIMPFVPSANTSAAVFMIAEKASDIVLGRRPLSAEDGAWLEGIRPDRAATSSRPRAASIP